MAPLYPFVEVHKSSMFNFTKGSLFVWVFEFVSQLKAGIEQESAQISQLGGTMSTPDKHVFCFLVFAIYSLPCNDLEYTSLNSCKGSWQVKHVFQLFPDRTQENS